MCPIPQALQRCCFALLLAGCLTSSLYARQVPPSESQPLPSPDDDPIHFEHLTTSDGLSSNIVTSVLQDHRGYLWVGTYGDGLLRYDGYEGKAYRHVEGDPAIGRCQCCQPGHALARLEPDRHALRLPRRLGQRLGQ